MDRKTARLVAAVFAALAVILAMLAIVIPLWRGKPVEFTALFGALMCLFFCIIVARDRGKK
jgi:hypothetical protein